MKNYLQKKGYKLKATKDYIIAEGTIPICLCAHLDTVGIELPSEIYYDSVNRIMWSPQLLGADDRAGVYAIIKILEKGYRPHIIFTTDEEKGGLGAQKLIEDFPECPF